VKEKHFFEQLFGKENVLITICIAIIAGVGVWSLFIETPSLPSFERYEGSRVIIGGVVSRDPEHKEHSLRLVVTVHELNSETLQNEKTNVTVSTDRFLDIHYGDRVRVTGVLRSPEAFETESGRTFNYPRYLLAHRITHSISFAETEVFESGKGNVFVASLLSVKHTLLRGMQKALPEPEGALLAGLLLGEKQSLGDTITDAFRNSGVVHIIVLSGYNVALVINSVLFVAVRIFPRLVAYSFAGVFVLGFAVMTGGSETTVRATIMAILMMIATVLHRPSVALRALAVAGASMAVWNPLLVLYDLSYQLSMVATLGLIIFSPYIQSKIRFVPASFGLREIVATTLATQITVLPILILSIGVVSLVFLPANVLVLPLVPIAMFVGFVASVVALASPLVALPFSALAYVLLKGIIATALFFGSLPLSTLVIPPQWLWVSLAVLVVAYVFVWWYVRRFLTSGV